jgi:hypothetical protein
MSIRHLGGATVAITGVVTATGGDPGGGATLAGGGTGGDTAGTGEDPVAHDARTMIRARIADSTLYHGSPIRAQYLVEFKELSATESDGILADDAPEQDLDLASMCQRLRDLRLRRVEVFTMTRGELDEWRRSLGTLAEIVASTGVVVHGS